MSTQQSLSEHYKAVLENLSLIAQSHFDLAEIGAAINALEAGKMLAGQDVVADSDRLALFLTECTILVGDYFQSPGNFDFVEERLQQTNELATTLAHKEGLAHILSLKGQLYYYRRMLTQTGTYAQATEQLEQAQKLFEELKDTRGISETIFFTGLIQEMQDKPVNAQSFYKQAYELASIDNHLYEKAISARHIASTYLTLGQAREALPFAKESLQIREELGIKRYYPYSLTLIANVYQKLCQDLSGHADEELRTEYLENARHALERGLTLANETNNSRMLAYIETELEQLETA